MRHPFFNPLWRRIATVLVCLLWALFEWSNGQDIWALVFGGIGVVSAWVFFVTWKPVPDDRD